MSSEAKVGTFVIVAIIIFVYTFISVANIQLGGENVTYRAYFTSAAGIDPGTRVRFGGLKAGVVSDVRPFAEDPTRSWKTSLAGFPRPAPATAGLSPGLEHLGRIDAHRILRTFGLVGRQLARHDLVHDGLPFEHVAITRRVRLHSAGQSDKIFQLGGAKIAIDEHVRRLDGPDRTGGLRLGARYGHIIHLHE